MSPQKGLDFVRERASTSTSTRKKVVVLLMDRTPLKGYLNASSLGRAETIDLLTPEGEHIAVAPDDVKSVYFVREFPGTFDPERKVFLSRPKLDGLWVRLRFRDQDVIEGIVANDLDIHGNNLRLFIPRSAIAEIKVLGVVGASRQTRRESGAVPTSQTKLFNE
jgi:hypothetical protein